MCRRGFLFGGSRFFGPLCRTGWCRPEMARAHHTYRETRLCDELRDVAAMFAELRALADHHAELHADRARLEAQIAADAEHRARLEMDVAGLKSELDQESARS